MGIEYASWLLFTDRKEAESIAVQFKLNCSGVRLILLGVWIDSGIFQDQVYHRDTENTEENLL